MNYKSIFYAHKMINALMIVASTIDVCKKQNTSILMCFYAQLLYDFFQFQHQNANRLLALRIRGRGQAISHAGV